MQPIKKILCATDLSKGSRHLLSFGVELCRRFDACFLVFHAVPPPRGSVARKIEFERGGEKQEQTKSAQDKINTHMAGCTIKWESVITYGDPVLETATAAEKANADIIMAASLGLSGFQQFFIGSVIGRLAQTVRHPFLVIPPGQPASQTTQAKLNSTQPDFSQPSFAHIAIACSLAVSDADLKEYAQIFSERFNSTLHLVHVMESPLNEHVVVSTSAPYEQVQNRLEERLSLKLKNLMPGKIKILHGVPGEELAVYAKTHGIDLIIAGIDEHPSRITPTTTAALLRHLPCTLLAIPINR